ncbi:hypothetical protein [Streptomyces sp. NPDC003327]
MLGRALLAVDVDGGEVGSSERGEGVGVVVQCRGLEVDDPEGGAFHAVEEADGLAGTAVAGEAEAAAAVAEVVDDVEAVLLLDADVLHAVGAQARDDVDVLVAEFDEAVRPRPVAAAPVGGRAAAPSALGRTRRSTLRRAPRTRSPSAPARTPGAIPRAAPPEATTAARP